METDDPSRFRPGSVLYLSDGLDPVTVRTFHQHGDRTIVGFEEVTDRNAAESLRGRDLLIPAAETRELGPEEYWDHELAGCLVSTTAGEAVGTVTDVLHAPANDLLEVDGTILVPMIGSIVREIDTQHKRIVIEPIPGLLSEE